MRKIRKRVFATVLAAAMLFTTPGMSSVAVAEGAQTEDISENVTVQAEDDIAEEPGAETGAMQEPAADDSDTDKPDTGDNDTEDTETDDRRLAAEETVPTQKEDTKECICETLCTEDSINEDCPVCGTEDADLSLCKGEKTENSAEENKEDYQPIADGRNGGICPACDMEISEEHKWEDGVCSLCGIKAVAKTQCGDLIGYVSADNFATAFSNSTDEDMIVTLLSDVALTEKIIQSGYIILDLNGYTVSGGQTAFEVSGSSFTVRDSGSMGRVQADGNAIEVIGDGKLYLYGGTFASTGDGYGVTMNGAVLCVGDERTNANVTIEKLFVGTVGFVFFLYTGTYIGEPAIETSNKYEYATIGSLLYNYEYNMVNIPHYAYYRNGKPLTGVLEQTALNGPVTVGVCNHDAESVKQYQHNDGTQTHTQTCLACGYTESKANCDYSFSGNIGTCQGCKSTLTVSVTGTDNLIYDGTEKKPEVTVMLGETELDASKYKVAYEDNINAGENKATVSVTIGEDHGTYTQTFTIGKATPTVAWSVNSQTLTYTGKQPKITQPDVTLLNSESFNGTIHYSYKKQGESAYKDGLPTDAGIYNIKAYIDTTTNYTTAETDTSLMLTINKADAEITVGTDTYNKSFGDAAFTLDVTDNNTEADVQYEVTGETDVVFISNGTVTIQNAGTAAITVSLPESANYNAAENKTITVNVAKKGGYTVSEINNSYYFDKQSTAKIDLAVLLPADCGAVSYGTPTIAGDVTYSAAPAVNDGELSYTVDRGSVDEKGTITIVVTARNYEDIIVTVAITRSSCDHVAGTEILYTGEGEKAPTCTEGGLGHRECTKCGLVMESEVLASALGHDYTSEVTKEPTISVEGEKTYTCSRCGDTYTETIPRRLTEGLWVSGLEPSYPYTGSAIKPEGIRVYHGSTLLCEKTEYTISYKNNTKAGTAQVIVTGKGSYKGKATAEFTIEAVDLSTDADISASVATATETGKNLKPTVTVTWNGKKLKEKTDYTLTYDANIKTASAEGYDITISGKGNYTGTLVRKFHVVPKGTTLLNSAKVTGLAKSYPYQEGKEIPEELEADLEKLVVKIGKTTLTKDDYTVRVEKGNAVGTGIIVLEAAQTSAYAGEKRLSFNVTGTNLKECYITGLERHTSTQAKQSDRKSGCTPAKTEQAHRYRRTHTLFSTVTTSIRGKRP